MKIANLANSITGAYLQENGSYKFGNASDRQYGKQCGGSTNDWLGLTGANRMGNTLASKMDGPDFKRVSEGGEPITGGYFVMDMGTEYGHVGVVSLVTYEDEDVTGFYAAHYNYKGQEERREEYIKKGSSMWNLIVGFGVGNPIREWEPMSNIDKNVVMPTISAMWHNLYYQPEDKRRTQAMHYLDLANDALEGKMLHSPS